MVHQLFLVSSIPHANYLQAVATLQAITGQLEPQEISTYTLITKPNHVFKPQVKAGKINQIEQHYMKCITTWQDYPFDISLPVIESKLDGKSEITAKKLFVEEEVVEEEEDDDAEKKRQRERGEFFTASGYKNGEQSQFGREKVWTLQIGDIPIAGKNQVCSQQTIYSSTLVHTHVAVPPKTASIDGAEAIQQAGQESGIESKQELKPISGSNESTIKEEKMAESNKDLNTDGSDSMDIDIVEQKIKAESVPPKPRRRNDSFLVFLNDLGYSVINQYWVKGVRFFYGDIVIELFKLFIRDDHAPKDNSDGIKLKLLDESNTFQIKCYINVSKSTDIDQINQGVKDLAHLKDFLKGLFVLEIPDRMYLDSRVSNPIK
ncbi:Mediator of RNA polymerase II transcription subunit 18 [Lodderomyces elongisporus]|uniref:Mediator of RNA polymerase II transcription subunit 18 n=1 Tax=Lodderomyces elongisporus TaxID=36914 RepID=UPI0029239B2E|nr:Mediator of RNA polymerase II transcription subunit 18 [Lodderomyces elongisporus]WLF79597.1 Mediator of RNA polymerase II transcription subunit 18 [Lodderomyces elongisporus]